jgi:hypothetical protein
MRVARIGSPLALTAGLLAGCQSSPPRYPYDNNPLVQARPPLQQTYGGNDRLTQIAQNGTKTVVPPPANMTNAAAATSAAPGQRPANTSTLTTYTPPQAPDAGPTMPDPVYSSQAAPPAPAPQAPATEMVAVAAAPPAPAPTPSDPPISPPATPPMSPAAAPPPPVVPAVARTVNGSFGHASDYSWLQGELDRHYRGYMEVRFRPVSEDDPFGGKVRLEDDPRLREFKAGDVVAIEGDVIRDADGAAQAWGQNPRYRIRSIRLVERQK